MQMHNKDTSKMESNMDMKGNDAHMDHNMGNMNKMENMDAMQMAKANLGPIKTIASKFPPRTVRYDLYIRILW